MPNKRTGNFISGTPQVPSLSSNNGIFDLKDEYTATINNAWQEPDGWYEIPRSLRLRNSVRGYLNRYFPVSGNAQIFTFSTWVKRSKLGQRGGILAGVNSAGGDYWGMEFSADDTLAIYDSNVSTSVPSLKTTQLFRDASAWYHIVVSVDTTQAIPSNRCKLYINGVIVTSFSNASYPSQNASTRLYAAGSGYISVGEWGYPYPSTLSLDGYITETNFIDSQSLDPSYFGYFDPITNIWQPKQYSGTYGVTGFYLPVSNNASTTTLGWDYNKNPQPQLYPTTVNGCSITTSVSKFGGSSLSVDGAAGSNLTLSASSSYAIGTGVYCVEAWVNPQSGHANVAGNSAHTVISQGNNANNVMWMLQVQLSGTVYWGFTGAGVTTSASYNVCTIGAWNHVVVTRDASNVERIFINGQLVNQRTNTTNYNNVSDYAVRIGSMYDTNYPGAYGVDSRGNAFKGYLQDVRLTIGVIPSYYQTSSTTLGTQIFTPPTSALPIGIQGSQDALTSGWNSTVLHFPMNGANGATTVPQYIANTFTANNISLTSGVTYDSMVDSPTNIGTSATDVGGVVSGNYAIINPLISTELSITNGGLTFSGTSASNARMAVSSILATSGKWYFEMTAGSTAIRYPIPGVQAENTNFSAGSGGFPGGYAQNGWGYGSDGNAYANNGAGTAFGSSFTSGDVISIAFDVDAGKVWAAKNGVWQASGNPAAGTSPAYTITAGTALLAGAGSYSGAGTHHLNFGQRPFAYTPPAGFNSLNTTTVQSLGTSTVASAGLRPSKHFDVTTYGGTGQPSTLFNRDSFQPDFVWIKDRTRSANNILVDTVRGVSNLIRSEQALGEVNAAWVTSLNSNGFSVPANTSSDPYYTNVPGDAFVGWQWKGSNATPVSNTSGSITSTVSANTAAGFSIVSYTLNNSTFTVGHGLGAVPKMIMVKNRDTSNNWDVYHSGLGAGYRIMLNSNAGPDASTQPWNNTAPTSSVFSGNSAWWSSPASSRMIAYCFAEVPGFSKFGIYTGNGSTDGPFIYCGFRPRFILIKRTTGINSWHIADTARDPINPSQQGLWANENSTESNGSNQYVDLLSNGFKLRNATGEMNNGTSDNYIYAAFAESPFALNNRAR